MDSIYKRLDNAGFDTRSYSGRSMYGKTCLGLVIKDHSELPMLHKHLNNDEMNYLTDSMGLNFIIYWPSIPYEKYEDEDNLIDMTWGDD